MLPRIKVDFDTIKQEERWRRIPIDVESASELLDILKPDLRVVLFAPDDLEVEGTIEFDSELKKWYGLPDWRTVYYHRLASNPYDPTNSDKLPRILADLDLSKDMRRRIHIPTHVNPELLKILRPDLRVVLYEEKEFEVEAVIVFDDDPTGKRWPHRWYGLPDWSTVRYYDDETQPYIPPKANR